jgi:hypothetical protein
MTTEITKTHTGKSKNYTEMVCKSSFAKNSGGQAVHLENHLIKFQMHNKWMEIHPTKEVVKIFHHVYNN